MYMKLLTVYEKKNSIIYMIWKNYYTKSNVPNFMFSIAQMSVTPLISHLNFNVMLHTKLS